MPNSKTADAADYVVSDDFDVDARPAPSTGAVKAGWGEALAPRGGYTTETKITDKVQVFRFIDKNDASPVASYKTHFLNDKPKGRKMYVCLASSDNPDCPLCDMDPRIKGQKAESKVAFSVINFSVDPFERQLLIATPALYRPLHTTAHSELGPLDSRFWGIMKTGERQTTKYHLTPIKPRDLDEDWGINEAAAMAMIDATEPFDSSVIRETSYAELVEIAAELS